MVIHLLKNVLMQEFGIFFYSKLYASTSESITVRVLYIGYILHSKIKIRWDYILCKN